MVANILASESIMKTSVLALSWLVSLALARPAEVVKRANPTVTVPNPDATIVGLNVGAVDQFQAVPFMQ